MPTQQQSKQEIIQEIYDSIDKKCEIIKEYNMWEYIKYKSMWWNNDYFDWYWDTIENAKMATSRAIYQRRCYYEPTLEPL